MAAEFLEGASAQSSMAPSPHDVQAVLHALMDLEEKVSLSEAAELRPSLPNLLRGLMDLLHGWRFSTMEPDIIEALHIIALAEWQVRFSRHLSHHPRIPFCTLHALSGP